MIDHVFGLANVNRFWEEEYLHDQTKADEDYANPLGPTPAKRIIRHNGSADDTTSKRGHNDCEGSDSNLFALFMTEELGDCECHGSGIWVVRKRT